MSVFDCLLSGVCMLGNFAYFLSGIPSVSNRLDPDVARHFVWPDLDPNCLQRLSANNTSKQRVNALLGSGKG